MGADDLLLGRSDLELELTKDGIEVVSQDVSEWADELLLKRSDLEAELAKDGTEVVSQDVSDWAEG